MNVFYYNLLFVFRKKLGIGFNIHAWLQFLSLVWQLSGTLSWELCPTQGRQPKALGHTTAVVGDTLYIFGGIYRGNATNALYMLNIGTNEH